MERFDVAIIGAGPAGSAAAYVLAKEGFQVLVVERGNYPGSKNVFGGRIYSYPLRKLIPDFPKNAPIERYVTKENMSFLTEDRSFTIQFEAPSSATKEANSFTAIRAKFDKWLAEEAEARGAMVITGIRVDDLWRENGRIRGIVARGDRVESDVVIAADGAVSTFAVKAGLRPDLEPKEISVGVKETIELPEKAIEERFNLEHSEGAANVYAGYASYWLRGGAFLYTNRSTLSLGLVVSSEDLSLKRVEVHEIMTKLKAHPSINRLIKGGKVVEYSAHMVPELGLNTMPKLCCDGFLVAGDAAGFLINNGYTFRGVDLAIASGIAAAEVIKKAYEANDFSAKALSKYETFLRENSVLRDLETFRNAPLYLKRPRLYSLYPKLMCGIAERIYTIDGDGKRRILEEILEETRGKISMPRLLLDLFSGALAM